MSKILGEKQFFSGDKPSVLDCVVFGFLSWQLAGDENDDTVFKKELEKEEGEFKVMIALIKFEGQVA